MADIKKIKVGSTTYDIRDATAARSNHTHSFDTITNRGEAFLSWGGKNFSGSYGPIDAAMVPELGANRLAFMPANAVTIEYSRDGGSTWTDYGPTDPQKIDLFNGRGSSFTIGKATSGAGNIATNKYQLRVNIYTSAGSVYTVLNKFVIYLSTSGTNNNWCTIRARKQSDYTAGNDKWTTFADKISVSGWSGYNVINTSGITTYGNTASTQYGHIQFIFGCDTGSTNNSYAGLSINKIFGFGGVGWTTPSTMAKTGHMYTYDSSQNVIFPEGVSAKSFTEGGTSLANKYAAKSHTHNYAASDSAGGPANRVKKALTFGSKTYDGSTAQTITASDLGALTSHQDISGKVNKSGDTMTGDLNPKTTKGASLGTSSLYWNNIYGTTLYEDGTSLSNKYLGKTAKAADADKLDGNDSTYYLNYNNLNYRPTLGTAASKNTGTSSGNIPILDSNGKLADSVIPAVAITDTYVVATEAAMLALNAQKGDIAIRSDLNKSFVLQSTPASTLANWKELLTPTDAVLSVNGKTGAVKLNLDDINDGSTRKLADYLPLSGGSVTGALSAAQLAANIIETGTGDNNYFQSRKFRGEGDANTYYHAVDFGYAGHNQVDFYEYGGNYNFYINTQANTDSRQLLFGINPSGIKIPPAAGAKVLGTNAEGQVESHSLGIADISSLQSTLDGKVNSSSLATVAKTGSYNDLSNKPTIPDISDLVPYMGASESVNLGENSLISSDKITNGIRVNSVSPDGFHATFNRGSDGNTDNTYYSVYRYDGITHNNKKLLFPEKDGTFALTSDIPTALKNPNALTFGSKTYDGSSAQALTLDDLGGQAAGDYALKNEIVAKSLMSAKGDMIYASAANSPARLGIGSNGQFLSVVNGIPKWVANPNTDIMDTAGATQNVSRLLLIGAAGQAEYTRTYSNKAVYTQNDNLYAKAFYAASDRRLKENIKDLDLNCLDLVNNINLREFSWKADEEHKPTIGAIAQELKKVLPEKYAHEFIGGKETDDEYLSINDSKLVYLLIGAIQEQQKEIESLKAKIDDKNI